MVRDGFHYAIPMLGVAILIAWLAGPAWGLAPLLVAGFFLWFFRDPERVIPGEPGALVSPADGKVTHISLVETGGVARTRISIFLNVFDVHVNRSPIAGVIQDVQYRRGKFRNAMAAASAEDNEQNIVTLQGEGHTVIFKQIAGLLARRIVFYQRVGDFVERGERVGLIKFGSRVDVLLDAAASLQVKVGEHVRGGATVLAWLPAAPSSPLPASSAVGQRRGGWS